MPDELDGLRTDAIGDMESGNPYCADVVRLIDALRAERNRVAVLEQTLEQVEDRIHALAPNCSQRNQEELRIIGLIIGAVLADEEMDREAMRVALAEALAAP